jgi:Icc-related predicted phosphoesterase
MHIPITLTRTISCNLSKTMVGLLGSILLFAVMDSGQAQPIMLPSVQNRSADSSVQFILVGDAQMRSGFEFWREQNATAVKAVLEQVAQEHPAFACFLGDNVFFGSSSNGWSTFDSLTRPIRDREIPMISVMGNHDYYGSTSTSRANFFRHFPLLKNRSWNSIIVQSVAFILLDSNFGDLTNAENLSQWEWYRQTLKELDQDSAIANIIVACHHAPYTNSTVVNDNPEVQRLFVKPFMQSAKTRLFVTGHCHAYEHFKMGNKHFVVSGGCGPFQKLETDLKKRRHVDLFEGGSIRLHHFSRIVVQGEKLTLEMHRIDEGLQNWSVADRIQIR